MLYGDAHRFLLQSVSSRGVVLCSDSVEMLKQFITDISEEKVADIVRDINIKLKPLNQAIKIVYDESISETNLQKKYLVFISTGYDDATKSQNMFKKSQLKYFRSILEKIMSSDTGKISTNEALNAVKGKFSKTDAENILILFVKMFYLEKCDNENYVLGLRAIHEFDPYFRDNMPDIIRECSVCIQLVFKLQGHECPSCEKSVHKRCLENYCTNMKKWPCCQTAYDRGQIYSNTQNTQASRGSRTRRKSSSDVEMDTSDAIVNSQRPSKRNLDAIIEL